MLLGFAPAALRAAAATTFQIKADRGVGSGITGEIVYAGNARLVDGDLTIEADEIRANTATGLAVARGSVIVTQGSLRLLADEVSYNQTTRVSTGKNVRVGAPPLYLAGSSFEGTPERITLRDARVSYTEPGLWAPSLTATSLTYLPGTDTLHTDGARLRLGWLPSLRLPQFDRPVSDPLLGAISLRGGFRSSLGAFLDAELLVPVAPGARVGADFGVFTRRGVLLGPAAELKIDRPGLALSSTLRTGYIHDSGNRGLDVLARPVRADRGLIDWRHDQRVGDDLAVFGRLSYWSDSEVLRDFRPAEFYPVQVPDTFLEADHLGANSITSLFVRAQPNPFFQTQRRLPELRFDQFPMPVGAGVYQTFGVGFAVLSESRPTPGPEKKTTRFDTVYELTRPFSPSEWFSVKPVAGARLTYYTGATGGRDTYTRVLGELGADAELRSSAVFDYRNELWEIDGLRHLVTPRLSYRAIPGATRGAAFIPAIDRPAFSTYLQPLGLTDNRDIDRLSPTNTLRLGLGQTLQTRDPRYGSRDLAILDLAADWRLDPRAGQRAFSAVQAEFAVMPAPWLRVDTFARVDPRGGGLRELNTGVTLRDGDAWAVRVGNDFLEHQIRDYALDASWRLNETSGLVARLRYDAARGRITEQAYGLTQTVGNLWVFRWLFTLYDGPRRESSFGIGLDVELKRF